VHTVRTVLGGAVMCLVPVAALAQATPSIGEVAKQSAEQRAAGKPATKVYTNADLVRDPRDAASPAATGEAPAAGGYISKSTGKALSAEEIIANSQEKLRRDSAKMDESYWRRQAASLTAELERARKDVDVLATAPIPRTVVMQQIAARELEKARKVLADLEHRWTRLEESARYANAPKAWLEPQ
jgi:hypothetical protein